MCIAQLSSNHSVGSSEGARDLLWNLWESSATVMLSVIPLAMCLETRHPAYLELLCPPQQEASRPQFGNLRLLCWSGVQCTDRVLLSRPIIETVCADHIFTCELCVRVQPNDSDLHRDPIVKNACRLATHVHLCALSEVTLLILSSVNAWNLANRCFSPSFLARGSWILRTYMLLEVSTFETSNSNHFISLHARG